MGTGSRNLLAQSISHLKDPGHIKKKILYVFLAISTLVEQQLYLLLQISRTCQEKIRSHFQISAI